MPTLPLSKTEIANQSKPFGGAPKPWRIDSVIETRKLKVQLEAAALDHMPQDKELRDRAMDLLHGALFRGRMIAQERLNAGIDGLDVARMIASGADFVLLGRAFLYGVAALGVNGGGHVMNILKEELRSTMGQLGCAETKQLPEFLLPLASREPPLTRTLSQSHPFSQSHLDRTTATERHPMMNI